MTNNLTDNVTSDLVCSTRRLYLDLDGVMADFDAHFPATFGLSQRDMADDAMWAKINAHPSYFRDMPVCPGALDFFREIEHLRPIILTACPKSSYPHVAAQKRAWVREHLSRHVTILPVLGGRHKPLFMQEPGDVLIDDWDRNTQAWTRAGGVAILHRDFASTRAALAEQIDLTSPPTSSLRVEAQGTPRHSRDGLVEALDAVHAYIDATDTELQDAGTTRDRQLLLARELRDAVDPVLGREGRPFPALALGAIQDCVTHRDAWRRALTIAQHEIEAFDRALAALQAAGGEV